MLILKKKHFYILDLADYGHLLILNNNTLLHIFEYLSTSEVISFHKAFNATSLAGKISVGRNVRHVIIDYCGDFIEGTGRQVRIPVSSLRDDWIPPLVKIVTIRHCCPPTYMRGFEYLNTVFENLQHLHLYSNWMQPLKSDKIPTRLTTIQLSIRNLDLDNSPLILQLVLGNFRTLRTLILSNFDVYIDSLVMPIVTAAPIQHVKFENLLILGDLTKWQTLRELPHLRTITINRCKVRNIRAMRPAPDDEIQITLDMLRNKTADECPKMFIINI